MLINTMTLIMKLKGTNMKLLNKLLTSTQEELFDDISSMETVKVGSNYLLFNYDEVIKPMLCVHLDTINTHRNKNELSLLDIVEKEGIISLHIDSNASCLGADDRAGVWIALQIMNNINNGVISKNSYSIGFFCDEEIGGIGSGACSKEMDLSCVSAYIGLDRRNTTIGQKEVATYGCDNKELLQICKAYGYIETSGSFTDASNLSNNSNIACINLSIGYNMEHTQREYLCYDDMKETYDFLMTIPFANVVYNYTPYVYDDYFDFKDDEEEGEVVCDFCSNHEKLFKIRIEGTMYYLCESCMSYENAS